MEFFYSKKKDVVKSTRDIRCFLRILSVSTWLDKASGLLRRTNCFYVSQWNVFLAISDPGK
jgi:hypothetical protein